MQNIVSFIGLFCKRDHNFKEPTSRSHPIAARLTVQNNSTEHRADFLAVQEHRADFFAVQTIPIELLLNTLGETTRKSVACSIERANNAAELNKLTLPTEVLLNILGETIQQ